MAGGGLEDGVRMAWVWGEYGVSMARGGIRSEVVVGDSLAGKYGVNMASAELQVSRRRVVGGLRRW